MLNKTLVPSFLGLVAGLALSVVACNGGEENAAGGMGCVAGQAVACACPNGEMGSQICLADGNGFDACTCTGGGTDGGSGTTGDSGEAEDSEGMDQGADSTGAQTCGNGVEDPNECDATHPAYCAEDCETATGDGASTGEAIACEDEPTYQLMIPNVASVWESGGVMGFAAGNAMCAAMGADHVCDYEEVVVAEMKGEFAAMAAGGTAWLHRTTAVDIGGGVMSAPGVGGRCVDWTYGTNHLADGEFLTFAAAGAVTYTFDNDTNYDAAANPSPHVQIGLLECGGVNRAILCCYEECQPEG